ncbi:MAG: DNA methyltransferase, partial [Methanosarcinales archaeon]
MKAVKEPITIPIPRQKDCARYKMHKYWASKPWYVVKAYIEHFTEQGDIVLDPFCGSGVVACEALIARRKVIANDLNPIATFITRNTCHAPVDLVELENVFKKIESEVKDEIMEMYKSDMSCPNCDKNMYQKHVVRGPAVGEDWIVEARCVTDYGGCGKGKKRYLITPHEKQKILQIEKESENEIEKRGLWIPQYKFPEKFESNRITYKGMKTVDSLFTKRNLLALSILFKNIQNNIGKPIKNFVLLGLSNSILHCSKLKAENVRPMSVNGYWVPEDWIEENVWLRFKNRFYWHWGVLRGKKETNELINNYFRDANCFEDLKKDKNFLLLNQSALKLNNIPNNSVDYCFTDPPYGGSIQYEELTLLWRSWLGLADEETEKVLREKELIVNKYHPKDLNKYNEMLTDAIKEIYRVLKE